MQDDSKNTEEINISSNFIHNIIDKDNSNNVYGKRVHTRFPPEPNGYLHIGHAKSIYLNFGTAKKYNGLCNLRFDDTNPIKEDTEYIESIKEDVKWLGFNWGDNLFFASDYFEQLYECAVALIKKGKAYICDLSSEEIREYRGNLKESGKNSPYRDRSIKENLDLLIGMKNGEFEDGSRVLRGKIDMSSPNLNMRDPVLYRISRAIHHRTGNKWCIYPMYDFAHPISDALESITHSICTLEFEDHRPLYEWVLNELEFNDSPKQIEFARLEITNTVMSKRKLRNLVEENIVDGWDDPRMPTISGLRRRGYTPESIRDFCERIGVAKSKGIVDIALLEHCIREDLKLKKSRMMAVINPLKVIITNYPEDKVEYLDVDNNQENENMGRRQVPFSRILYIEKDDFMEDPPKKFFRLSKGKEVRFKNAYFVKCEEVIKDEQSGEIIELRCTYDRETKSGSGFTGRKVKGTIHWVSAKQAIECEFRLYDKLALEKEELENRKYIDFNGIPLNDESLIIKKGYVEPELAKAKPMESFQFLRQGYFCLDNVHTTKDKLVFNRTVSLKSSYKKKK